MKVGISLVLVLAGSVLPLAAQDKGSSQARARARLDLMTMADAEVAKIEQSGKVSKDPLLIEYIGGLGQRLVPPDAPSWLRFSFSVIEDSTLNAFALPNGAIYVHSGILARLESEAQLAAILGHEITHALKEHSLQQVQLGKKISIIDKAKGAILGGSVPMIPDIPLTPMQSQVLTYGDKLVHAASVNGFSRELEDEADEMGVGFMYQAGLDPREAPKPYELLMKTYGDESKLENFFYGDHSRNEDRVRNINRLLEQEYLGKLAGTELSIDSTEFRRRTRVLVRDNAILDYKVKRFELAQQGLERAVQAGPKDYLAHYYLGNVYRESGRTPADLDKALTEYEKTTELKADFAPAYRELGMVFYRRDDNERAVEAFREYLQLDPGASDRAAIESYIEELK